MPLFKPNRATQSAVAHPRRYAFTTAAIVLVIVIVGGATTGKTWPAIIIAVSIAVLVFLFDYFTFKPGGWGERWFRRNEPK